MLVAGGVLVAALLGVVTPASSRAADIGATSSSTPASSASTRSRARAAQVPAVLLSPSTTSRTTSAPMSADSNGVPSRGNTVNSGAFQALRRERPTEPARSTAPAGISTVTSEAVAAPLNASISVSIPSTAVSVSTPQTSQRAARLLPLVSPLSDLIFSGVAKGFATAQVELSKTLSTSAKGDTSARPALLAKLLRSEPTAELRRVAAWGLERFADTPVAIEALSNAVLQDSSSAVREMAAWALQGSDGSAKAISALANAARRDPAASVRYSAIWSLAHTANAKDKDALDALSAVAEARYANASDVREILAWAFGSMGPSSAPMSLTAMLADSAASVRITTAWALKTIGDPRTVSSLDAALRKEANHDAQFAMLRALASMGDAALPTISRLVDDTDPAIRALAIRSLAGAGLHDPWPQPRPRPRPRP
jgi:HEAT repeat protein